MYLTTAWTAEQILTCIYLIKEESQCLDLYLRKNAVRDVRYAQKHVQRKLLKFPIGLTAKDIGQRPVLTKLNVSAAPYVRKHVLIL